jgi:hypothetical protein
MRDGLYEAERKLLKISRGKGERNPALAASVMKHSAFRADVRHRGLWLPTSMYLSALLFLCVTSGK